MLAHKVLSHLLLKSQWVVEIKGLIRLATLLKKTLWHRSFPVNFAKFLRIPPVAASLTGHLRTTASDT